MMIYFGKFMELAAWKALFKLRYRKVIALFIPSVLVIFSRSGAGPSKMNGVITHAKYIGLSAYDNAGTGPGYFYAQDISRLANAFGYALRRLSFLRLQFKSAVICSLTSSALRRLVNDTDAW
ncbi:hypothetical protein ACQU0X_14480 [Pseudovibrio ascidiaceicola]|uniref:hypothetical protein n=1 Tax=Pseudovibrio ascidiaceicola TaxID=285279 RepID=UPI003D35C123